MPAEPKGKERSPTALWRRGALHGARLTGKRICRHDHQTRMSSASFLLQAIASASGPGAGSRRPARNTVACPGAPHGPMFMFKESQEERSRLKAL